MEGSRVRVLDGDVGGGGGEGREEERAEMGTERDRVGEVGVCIGDELEREERNFKKRSILLII